MNIERNKEKKILTSIYDRALKRADPTALIADALQWKDGGLYVEGEPVAFEKIFIAAIGKASCVMAKAVEGVIPDNVGLSGIAVTKYGHDLPLSRMKCIRAGHPIPDENSLIAGNEILSLLNKAGEGDLVLFLISGGGSAVMESLRPGISLDDLKALSGLLLSSGADITRINVLRKHLSLVKGGGLARAASPARQISLILSDVLGSDLSSIASGPGVPDPTTFADCKKIVDEFLSNAPVPDGIRRTIENGLQGLIPDTPKPGDPAFALSRHHILADNAGFLQLLSQSATEMGLDPIIMEAEETSGDGVAFIERLSGILEAQIQLVGEKNRVLILGGEVTLKIPPSAKGAGGRNQHLALLYASRLAERFPGVTALFASTDGTDGPTDASGAFSHPGLTSGERRKALGEAIADFDSNRFLGSLDELFVTGPTGNNLNDAYLFYIPGGLRHD